MKWKEKERLDRLRRLKLYIINKFENSNEAPTYISVDEVMKFLGCSRATACDYLVTAAQLCEKDGAVLKKIGNKLYLFGSIYDYRLYMCKLNNKIMASTTTTTPFEIKQVKCPKCGYVWLTKSKRIYVTCPSCKTSVKVDQNAVELNYASQLQSENSASKSEF